MFFILVRKLSSKIHNYCGLNPKIEMLSIHIVSSVGDLQLSVGKLQVPVAQLFLTHDAADNLTPCDRATGLRRMSQCNLRTTADKLGPRSKTALHSASQNINNFFFRSPFDGLNEQRLKCH